MRGLFWLLDALFPPRDTDLLIRDVTGVALAPLLTPTTLGDGSVTALFPYRDPIIHALIIETKYHGSEHAAHLLGTALGEYLLEYLADTTAVEKRPIALVPLPLSRKRRQSRGYNQIQNVLRVTSSLLGDAATIQSSVLTRVRDTTPQTRLGKQARKENVAEAFVAQDVTPEYLYIVVDDVYTTGATLTEAIHTLEEAGAARVRGVALAW